MKEQIEQAEAVRAAEQQKEAFHLSFLLRVRRIRQIMTMYTLGCIAGDSFRLHM